MTDEKRNEIINRIASEIKDMFEDVEEVSKGGGTPNITYCREAATKCVKAKGKLIDLLSKHPKWDEDNLRVHFTADYTRPVDTDAARDSLSKLGRIIEKHADPGNAHKFSCQYLRDIGLYVSTNPNQLLTLARIFQEYPFNTYLYGVSRVSEVAERHIKAVLPDARIHAGSKTTRAVFAMLRQYGWEDALRGKNVILEDVVNPQTGEFLRTIESDVLARARAQYNNYADQMNELKVTRHTVISVNPMDFLRMSYGNSWGSCHYIATRDHWYNGDSGCYSAGCWSYAYDEETIIFYTVDEGVNEDDITYADKYTRQLYFWNGRALMPSRLYPANDDLSSPVYTENREIMEQVIADCTDHGNMWKKLPYTSSDCEIDSYGHHYRDYNCHRYPIYAQSFLVADASDDEMRDFCDFTIGSDDPICVCCGNELDDDESPVCSGCSEGRYVCACCGDRYSDGSSGYWIEDEYGDSEWVCGYCASDRYTWDEIDERYIPNDDAVRVNGLGYTHSDNCTADNDISYCDNCGEYYYNELFEEVDGEYLCASCLDSLTAVCERCGERHLLDIMVKTEDGGYVCEDCVEDDEYECDCCGTLHKGQPAEVIGSKQYCQNCYDNARHTCKYCGSVYYDATLEDACPSCYENHFYYDRQARRVAYAEPSVAADEKTLLVVRSGYGTMISELSREQFEREISERALGNLYYEILVPMDFECVYEPLHKECVPYKGKLYNCVRTSFGCSRSTYIGQWLEEFMKLTARKTEEEVA